MISHNIVTARPPAIENQKPVHLMGISLLFTRSGASLVAGATRPVKVQQYDYSICNPRPHLLLKSQPISISGADRLHLPRSYARFLEPTDPTHQQSLLSYHSVEEHIAHTLDSLASVGKNTLDYKALTVSINHSLDRHIITSIDKMIPSSQWRILAAQMLF